MLELLPEAEQPEVVGLGFRNLPGDRLAQQTHGNVGVNVDDELLVLRRAPSVPAVDVLLHVHHDNLHLNPESGVRSPVGQGRAGRRGVGTLALGYERRGDEREALGALLGDGSVFAVETRG